MRKLFILALAIICAVFICSVANAAPVKMKSGVSIGAATGNEQGVLITGHGGTLYRMSGRAVSASASYVLYDSSTVLGATGATNSLLNILTEGGEATQYDSIGPLDFGDEGLDFANGLVIVAPLADITVAYK